MDYSIKPATITKIKRLDSSTLIALFSILLPSEAEIHSNILKLTEDRRWLVIPPRIPLTDENGELRFDGAKRLIWGDVLSFRNNKIRDHFVQTCVQAIGAQHPDILSRKPELRAPRRLK